MSDSTILAETAARMVLALGAATTPAQVNKIEDEVRTWIGVARRYAPPVREAIDEARSRVGG